MSEKNREGVCLYVCCDFSSVFFLFVRGTMMRMAYCGGGCVCLCLDD